MITEAEVYRYLTSGDSGDKIHGMGEALCEGEPGWYSTPKIIGKMLEHLKDPDGEVRLKAAYCCPRIVGAVKDRTRVRELLLDMIRTETAPSVRGASVMYFLDELRSFYDGNDSSVQFVHLCDIDVPMFQLPSFITNPFLEEVAAIKGGKSRTQPEVSSWLFALGRIEYFSIARRRALKAIADFSPYGGVEIARFVAVTLAGIVANWNKLNGWKRFLARRLVNRAANCEYGYGGMGKECAERLKELRG